MGLRSAVLACAVSSIGCATLAEYQGGPALAMQREQRTSPGIHLSGHMGMGLQPSNGKTIGGEMTARMKFMTETQSLAVGPGIYAVRDWGGIAAIYRLGGTFFFERYDDKLFVGVGPYGSAALALPHREEVANVGGFIAKTKTFITFGPVIDVSARIARDAPVFFVGLAVGVAYEESLTRPRTPPALEQVPIDEPPSSEPGKVQNPPEKAPEEQTTP